MKKTQFNIENHPKYGNRKDDLDPTQKGLVKKTKKYLEKKKSGEDFERQLCEMLAKAFPEDIVIPNIYFESGNYIESLKMYESLQMDILLVTSAGVFCVEAKWISNDKYVRLSGSALAKKWTLKTKKGTSNGEINGLKQNYRHLQFLEELFENEEVECPVYQMTVIGDLERDKIAVQQFIDGNLVDTGEMIERISYIKKRNETLNIDIEKIVGLIKDWQCTVPGIETLHMVYARNISKKRLPVRCKEKMRRL